MSDKHTDQSRTESAYQDRGWYWIEREGWAYETIIAPAMYKAECDAWYSVEFSGSPTREVKVLEPIRRATTEQSSGVELPEPVAWLIERHAFSVSPHGQDAEGNSWLEEAHEPGEQGSFAVYTEQQVRALLSGVKDSLTVATAVQWCTSCGEGVTTFCRGKTDNCPRGLPLPGKEQA